MREEGFIQSITENTSQADRVVSAKFKDQKTLQNMVKQGEEKLKSGRADKSSDK